VGSHYGLNIGPYKVVHKLGPVDYVIAMPDKRKTERTCHVNMLKPYIQRNLTVTSQFVRSEQDYPVSTIFISEASSDNQFKLDGLTPQQHSELQNVLSEFNDTFSDDPGKKH